MRTDQRRRRNGEFNNEDLYRFMTLQECDDPTAELEQAMREGIIREVSPGWYTFVLDGETNS